MSTGFSGNLGFPLPTNWSYNQIKEDYELEIDHVVKRGTDDGVSTATAPGRTHWNLEGFAIDIQADMNVGATFLDNNYLGYGALGETKNTRCFKNNVGICSSK